MTNSRVVSPVASRLRQAKASANPAFVFAVLAVIPFAVVGCTKRNQSQDKVANNIKPMNVVAKDGTLMLGDRRINWPCDTEVLVELFGEPSRTFVDLGTVHTWDDQGVFAHLDAPDGDQYAQIGFAIDRCDARFWPTTLFNGSITVEGESVTHDTTQQLLNKGFEEVGAILYFKQLDDLVVCVNHNTSVIDVTFSQTSRD
ncbi:MAG: hypothetical protein WD030_05695 [Pirellulales bacterium]